MPRAATQRAPGVKRRAVVPRRAGIYKDRQWWRVGHGKRFLSYRDAVAYLASLEGVPPDKLACRPRVPSKAMRVRNQTFKATLYRGVLERAGRFRCRLFGVHAGYTASLEDAVQL